MTMDKSVNNIDIYIFTMEDYDEVYRLWQSVFPGNTDFTYSRERIKVFLDRNPDTCFIAKADNRIIGVILAGNDGRRGYIYHFGVLKDYRKSGVGRLLIARAEEALAKTGIDRITLFVFKDNEPAKEFYHRIGYSLRTDLDIFSKKLR